MQIACYVIAGPDGQPVMGIQAMEGDVVLQLNLCTNDTADDVVRHFIDGLKEARADLKRQASGLIVPTIKGLEVPNGFRKPKGGVKPGAGSAG